MFILIDWSAYPGGSYNGFEEIDFAFFATHAEGLLLGGVLVFRRYFTITRRAP